MRLIDADALTFRDVKVTTNEIDIFGFGGYLIEERKGILQEEIWNAPTIDVEPVIRCKDCKQLYYYEPSNEYSCDINLYDVNLMDFCSFAERKDDDDNC